MSKNTTLIKVEWSKADKSFSVHPTYTGKTLPKDVRIHLSLMLSGLSKLNREK